MANLAGNHSLRGLCGAVQLKSGVSNADSLLSFQIGQEWPARNSHEWLLPWEALSPKVIADWYDLKRWPAQCVRPLAQERRLIPPHMPDAPLSLILLTAVPSLHNAGHAVSWIAVWFLRAAIPWGVWLPYLSGAIVLALGLNTGLRQEFAHARGLDKIVTLGPILLAAPVAVFGAEHFTFAAIVAGMVPSWIPGHLFWALFVGACLIGSALSIAVRKYAGPSALLLGIMICLFVLLIHIPGIAASPGKRLLWVVGLRDLAFAGGAFSVAATQAEAWSPEVRQRLVTIARLFIAVPVTFLGVQQFLHPELAPGVPLAKLTPLWLPAHLLWAFLTGAVFVVAGLCLIVNKEARLAATWLGLMVLLLVVVLYVPIVVTNPSDIGNGLNYLADTLLLGGTVLALAGAATWEFLVRAHTPVIVAAM